MTLSGRLSFRTALRDDSHSVRFKFLHACVEIMGYGSSRTFVARSLGVSTKYPLSNHPAIIPIRDC